MDSSATVTPSTSSTTKQASQFIHSTDDQEAHQSLFNAPRDVSPAHPFAQAPEPTRTFRVYKRRFFGLIQLVLLNIVVSWCWLTYAPVSTTASQFFDVSVSSINWLSSAFFFAFCAATPATIYVLNKKGPKGAIICASFFILIGNLARLGGTKSITLSGPSKFGVVMFGQIFIGFGQPFVLSAPTRYSDVWFSEQGRVAATAVTSLANPLGGALGQLINPFWATQPSDIPDMTLYVTILACASTLPTIFIPRAPPTPPTPTSSLNTHPLNLRTIQNLTRNPSFWILLIPFGLLVTAFNAISSELNSILYPYGYSETAAGLTGALLIIVGLVASAVTSPLLDKYTTPSSPFRLLLIKLLVLVTAITYLAFIFAPGTRGLPAPYIIAAIMGAASFMLVPLALELLVEVTWDDAGPEVSSAICWASGQLGGAITIIVMDALSGKWKGEPAGNMKAGLVYLTLVAWLAVPTPLLLGYKDFGRARRSEMADERRREESGDAGG